MSKIITYIKNSPLFWLIFFFALAIRLIYQSFGFPDYWGDAYHSILMSKLLVENNWIYSDYSGREVVWMPFYRYMIAVFMYLFDNYSFIIPHTINNIIGALTCAISALLVHQYSTRRFGILSGILLSILPWHIAYSNLNTPENLGSFILILVIYVWASKKWIWLIPIAFIGVLTRNEVTLMMALFGVFLLWKKDWKPAIGLFIGAIAGLTIWGSWCYQRTGNFFWWITERSIGSSWDHLFQIQEEILFGAWYIPFLSWFQAIPYVLIFILYPSLLKQIWKSKDFNTNPILKPVLLMITFDWLFIFFMQFNYYSYPEPKYYIMTLPLSCLGLVLLIDMVKNKLPHRKRMGYSMEFISAPRVGELNQKGYRPAIKLKISKALYTIGLLILLIQIPVFYFLPFSSDNYRAAGKFIKENIPKEGNVWLDHTVIWYYSGLETSRIHSSYTLASRDFRHKSDFQVKLRTKMEALDIRYILSKPSSYTYVFDIWPQMKEGNEFEWKGLIFSPIYSYQKPAFDISKSTITERIIDKVISNDGSAIFWEIIWNP